MKHKHVGLAAKRLDPKQDNPRELAFALQWQQENDQSDLLVSLLGKAGRRDREVAATVIQWLGSNVGQSFIGEAAKRSAVLKTSLLGHLKISKDEWL